MESADDQVLTHEAWKSSRVSGLDSSSESRRLSPAGSSATHPSSSSSRQLAPNEAAKLVGDAVCAVLEAAYVAAAQVHTKTNSVVTDAQRVLGEFQRSLDELSHRLSELEEPIR